MATTLLVFIVSIHAVGWTLNNVPDWDTGIVDLGSDSWSDKLEMCRAVKYIHSSCLQTWLSMRLTDSVSTTSEGRGN